MCIKNTGSDIFNPKFKPLHTVIPGTCNLKQSIGTPKLF